MALPLGLTYHKNELYNVFTRYKQLKFRFVEKFGDTGCNNLVVFRVFYSNTCSGDCSIEHLMYTINQISHALCFVVLLSDWF